MFGRSSSSKNRSSNGKHGGPLPEAEQTAAKAGEGAQQLSQAFDLLFGAALREQTQGFHKLEAEVGDRLDSLERACLRHAETIEELNDKASAALEREQAEYRRRKAIETDMRQKLGQLRASADKVVEETAQGMARFREDLEAFRATQAPDQLERHHQLIQEMLEELALIKSSFVDRATLSNRIERLAREIVTEPTP